MLGHLSTIFRSTLLQPQPTLASIRQVTKVDAAIFKIVCPHNFLSMVTVFFPVFFS